MELQTFTFLLITYYSIGNCAATIPKYRGDLNVMHSLGFQSDGLDQATHYYRLNENHNNFNSGVFLNMVSLNSFAFEGILRWDEVIESNVTYNDQEFVFFSLGDPEKNEDIFEISMNGTDSKAYLKIRMKTDADGVFETIVRRYQLSCNNWHKILLTFEDGIIQLRWNCDYSFILNPSYPKQFSAYIGSFSVNFHFSVGYFKGPDGEKIYTFGKFDIFKMKFYSGYLRPSELNCCDVPQLCNPQLLDEN